MRWDRRTWMGLAALSGLMSVLAGAFAAHGVSDPMARELLKTGASYQAIHALAAIACAVFIGAGARRARFAAVFFLTGTVLFSGSLYALAFGAPRWLGAATPIGGVLFLLGWAVLVWAAWSIDSISGRLQG